jgi:hypothetical protein
MSTIELTFSEAAYMQKVLGYIALDLSRAHGVGREGRTDSLEFFTEAKNVCIKLG